MQSSVKNLGLAIDHEDAFESILIKFWEILYVIFQAWVYNVTFVENLLSLASLIQEHWANGRTNDNNIISIIDELYII